MPQTKLLVDTCSYFRLAQNIHPLLAATFGRADYTLYAHAALKEEFERKSRLQTKFDWFSQRTYAENRSRPLQIGRKESESIDATHRFVWSRVVQEYLKPSPVDVRILATAMDLGLTMVTDDQDLLALAKDYEVTTMTSVELLRLMLNEKHITMDKVKQVVSQWLYDRDMPANFQADYRRLFGEAPPKE